MNSAAFLNILSLHQGRDRGVTGKQLACICEIGERDLRSLVAELREQGIAICATPETGYFMAVTPEELQESCKFLHDRAMRSLLQAGRMQKISLPDLLGQLKLNEA